MNICLFEENEINKPLILEDERCIHLLKILHKKEGDTFTSGIIGGKSGISKILKIVLSTQNNSEKPGLYFDFTPLSEGKILNPLKMIIGFPRPIQLKRLLRDVAALGVCEVHLCGTELGEKSYMQSTLVEKGNAYKMLLDGTVQAGSTHVPKLFLYKSLVECLDSIDDNINGKILKLALDNVNPLSSLNDAVKNGFDFTVAAIGSERGWTDKERNLLEQRNYLRCGMGERIMRTETASTVAASIILNKLGYLGI